MSVRDLLGVEELEYLDAPPPVAIGRGSPEPDYQSQVRSALGAAVEHHRSVVEPVLVRATQYYLGHPFGDEREGYSKVVSTDVRDAVLDCLPDLLEVFLGSDSPVEFRPRGPEDVEQAAQATDLVNYVFREENSGFLVLHAAFKDALTRRIGWVKWRYEPQERVRGATMSGLTGDEVAFLYQQGISVELESVSTDEQGQETYTVRVIRSGRENCYRVEAVPPEEVVWYPGARSLRDSPLVAHVRDATVDELVRLGIPVDFVERHAGSTGHSLQYGYGMRHARDSYTPPVPDLGDSGESRRTVPFAEVYMLVDSETHEGQSELRMFQCVGPEYKIWNGDGRGELVDEVPFAAFVMDPEPHTMSGLSFFDLLQEVQRVKSELLRGTLNSLAQSIEPKWIVTENVNLLDLTSPTNSGLIRVRRDVNAIRELRHQFVGPDVLAVLDYYDRIRSDRQGQIGPGEGLDPRALQSTTAEAISVATTRSQRRVRMIARCFAETGMRDLFLGLYRLVVRHQDKPKVIRVRGKYVPIDPRSWDVEADVIINVALGTGSKSQRVGEMMALLADQKEHILNGSPLVTLVELRNTYSKLIDLLGYRDVDSFYRPWGPEEQAALDQAQAQAPEQDPQKRVAEAAELEVRLRAEAERQKLELERQKLELERQKLDLERDKVRLEYELELRKLKEQT